MQARGQLLQLAKKNPAIGMLRPNGLDDEPQYQLDLDWEKASALGLSIADISNTLAAGWGSTYVNQFIDRGRVKKVFIQGDEHTRMLPQDLDRWYVRNAHGTMVPFSAFSPAHWTYGSPKLERYNGSASLEFLGAPAPGKSSGDAMEAMEKLANAAAQGYRLRLDRPVLRGAAVRLAGAGAVCDFAGDRVPVPGGAVRELVDSGRGDAGGAARYHRHRAGDVAARPEQRCVLPGRTVDHRRPGGQERDPDRGIRQGKLTTQGMQLIEATVTAARQRLRPILMTSLAFILGVLPLAIATGAGAGGRTAIGTGVTGGMITATVLAIFFVPVFFVVDSNVVQG